MDFWKAMQTEGGFEQLKQQLMDLDSAFKFKCRRCGKCCKNQNTILFSPWDVFRIAKKTGKIPSAVVRDYTEVYIGPQSRIPVVHLLMKGKKNACPLLTEEGRCSIHDIKPTVCALYPLGRVVTSEAPGQALDGDAENIVRYILSGQCGSAKKTNTVREWLASFGIPENDEFFYLWTGIQLKLSLLIRELEDKGASIKALQPIWNVIFTGLYTAYDTEQKFMPQFEQNTAKLLADLSALQKELDALLGSE